MESIIQQIIDTTLCSFDFGYCVIVNIISYFIISYLSYRKKNKLNIWTKRIVMIAVALVIAICYYVMDYDVKVIFNSFILAPVSWSWIFKPICNKLHIDYKDFVNREEK